MTVAWLTCREFVDFLDDYLAGTLPADLRLRFEDHLSGCPSCVTYMQTYREAMRLGKAVLAPSADAVPAEVPEDLVRAILDSRPKKRGQ